MKTILALASITVAVLLSNPFIRIVMLAAACFGVILYLGSKAVKEPLQSIETEEE